MRTRGAASPGSRHQVQRIAPRCLFGRDDELAELAEFCTSPLTSGRYAWWRAEAWSGKSALMSWFVLHPPPGVRIVSFFVTARMASQGDRPAFIDNVLEQLLALLGEGMPTYLCESTRDAHLLGLLASAAEACQRRGENLVLLVDGLDEDCGMDSGPDAHSIAGLLPAEPPAGMRVVVAGRPNPPIPADVPRHHPLRDETIVRALRASERAIALAGIGKAMAAARTPRHASTVLREAEQLARADTNLLSACTHSFNVVVDALRVADWHVSVRDVLELVPPALTAIVAELGAINATQVSHP
jgi:hypothetical protein